MPMPRVESRRKTFGMKVVQLTHHGCWHLQMDIHLHELDRPRGVVAPVIELKEFDCVLIVHPDGQAFRPNITNDRLGLLCTTYHFILSPAVISRAVVVLEVGSWQIYPC